jgi:hypothetical protein
MLPHPRVKFEQVASGGPALVIYTRKWHSYWPNIEKHVSYLWVALSPPSSVSAAAAAAAAAVFNNAKCFFAYSKTLSGLSIRTPVIKSFNIDVNSGCRSTYPLASARNSPCKRVYVVQRAQAQRQGSPLRFPLIPVPFSASREKSLRK